jgi:hypothetical protein
MSHAWRNSLACVCVCMGVYVNRAYVCVRTCVYVYVCMCVYM